MKHWSYSTNSIFEEIKLMVLVVQMTLREWLSASLNLDASFPLDIKMLLNVCDGHAYLTQDIMAFMCIYLLVWILASVTEEYQVCFQELKVQYMLWLSDYSHNYIFLKFSHHIR